MDWELLIDIISDSVKDEETRTEIYKRFLEADSDVNQSIIESQFGIDDAFDNAWNIFESNYSSEDLVDFDNEDEDYENDDDGEWNYDDSDEDASDD